MKTLQATDKNPVIIFSRNNISPNFVGGSGKLKNPNEDLHPNQGVILKGLVIMQAKSMEDLVVEIKYGPDVNRSTDLLKIGEFKGFANQSEEVEVLLNKYYRQLDNVWDDIHVNVQSLSGSPFDVDLAYEVLPCLPNLFFNFQEALEKKRSLGNEVINVKGTVMRVLVMPTLEEDIRRYVLHYNKDTFYDETAQTYCSNGIFQVLGVYISGNVFVHHRVLDEL